MSKILYSEFRHCSPVPCLEIPLISFVLLSLYVEVKLAILGFLIKRPNLNVFTPFPLIFIVSLSQIIPAQGIPHLFNGWLGTRLS